jgi:transcriptional regulator with GAF, ATPase, and Fis domain
MLRLSGYRLSLPPLRPCGDNVILTVRTFPFEEAEKLGRDPPKLTRSVRRRLKDHHWPGNVRALDSFAASVVFGLEEGGVVKSEPSPVGDVRMRVSRTTVRPSFWEMIEGLPHGLVTKGLELRTRHNLTELRSV